MTRVGSFIGAGLGITGGGRSEPVSGLPAVDVGEDEDEPGGEGDEERHDVSPFHAGKGAAGSRRKSGRREKDSLKGLVAAGRRRVA